MIGQNTAFGTKIMGGDTGIPFIFYQKLFAFFDFDLVNRAGQHDRPAPLAQAAIAPSGNG